MRKKVFVLFLSLCLLFCCPLVSLASSESSNSSGRLPDSLLQTQDVTFYYKQSPTFPAYVELFDFNSAVLDRTSVSGNVSFARRYSDIYDEYYEGTFNEVTINSATYYRFSGTADFYFLAVVPASMRNVYATGRIEQFLSFDSIEYMALDDGVQRSIPVSNAHCLVRSVSMYDGVGQTFDGVPVRPGSFSQSAYLSYRFNNAGIGGGNQYLKVTVEYSFLVYGMASGVLPSEALNGYARLRLSGSTGSVTLASGYVDSVAFDNRFTSGLESVMESQNDQMMNGYENGSGAAALESGAASVDTGIQEEHAAIDNAGSLAADYDYESADMSELATAFSLISGWFMSLIQALGSWNMLVYISLTMIVALFAIGYFRH